MKKILIPALALGISATASNAQDSTSLKVVSITSSFKPTLKEAAKINMNASPAPVDTSRPSLNYNVPSQNLNFAFQPGSLKPLALQVADTGLWNNEGYVKAGYGNFKTPFIQAGVALGTRDAGANVYLKSVSSKGKLAWQDYSNARVDIDGHLKTGNVEWLANFGASQQRYNRYGFEPKSKIFPNDDSLKVRYLDIHGGIGFHNINRTPLGISYAPQLKLSVFNDIPGNRELNTYVDVPVKKNIGENFEANLGLTASLTRYSPQKGDASTANFFYLAPSVVYKKENAFVQLGIRPAWASGGKFNVLPNVRIEFNTPNNAIGFQMGWISSYRTSGFNYLANFNPYILPLDTLSPIRNTRIEERFAGIKGSLGDHFNYAAKASFDIYHDQPLFVNDMADGRTFQVLNEPEMKVVSLSGQLGYTVADKFSLISSLAIRNFRPQNIDKAYGLIPLEWKTDIRLQVLKDLYVTSTIYAFDGPWSHTKSGNNNLGTAVDLSAGLEFKVYKNIGLWAQFNNITNKEYQRWNQYPVYGFNFLGGVLISFPEKK